MVKVKTADILTLNINISILPKIVQEISRIIGLQHCLKLVDHYKGVRMWVPTEFRDDHVLCKIIGHEHAAKLIEQYGGDTIDIPKCDHALRTMRNATIIKSDKSQRQLAIEYDLTDRQIRNIQKEAALDFDERQDNLF